MKIPVVWMSLMVLGSGPSFGIVGCMTEIEELVSEADSIILGRVVAVESKSLAPCKWPRIGESTSSLEECGDLPRLVVKVEKVISGDAPSLVRPIIPTGFLELSCDDRPSTGDVLGSIEGKTRLFFLSKKDGYLWAVDGVNGIYEVDYENRVLTILKAQQLRLTLDFETDSTRPGGRVKILHILSDPSSEAFKGCIGQRITWRLENPDRRCVYAYHEGFGFACEKEFLVRAQMPYEWDDYILVPSNAPDGDTMITARVQILDRDNGSPLAYAFIESDVESIRVSGK